MVGLDQCINSWFAFSVHEKLVQFFALCSKNVAIGFQQQEREKLEKIQAVSQKSDVQNALDAFAQMQEKKEEHIKTKEEIAAENREKRLREMRDKLKAKQEHAAQVRKRKQLEAINMDNEENNGSLSSRSIPAQ